MKKLLPLLLAALFLTGVSQALEGPKVAASGPSPAVKDRAPQAQGAGESDMQAVCREVLVDIDPGYGVTSHESRFVCEELR
ncbi:hypothetical protein V3H18_03890 [Methylocystis sp. 9N]|uniref:Porin n=1 Tax=Methylocystis borbori TaxID=3118750 RepID=A0ABU7XE52_9HYPH